MFFKKQIPKQCKHKMKKSVNNFVQIFYTNLWNIARFYQTKKVAKILGGDVVLKFSTPDLGASFVATFLVHDEPLKYASQLMH